MGGGRGEGRRDTNSSITDCSQGQRANFTLVESIKGSLKTTLCQTESINTEELLLHVVGRRDINAHMTDWLQVNDQELYNNAMMVALLVGSVKGSLKPHYLHITESNVAALLLYKLL